MYPYFAVGRSVSDGQWYFTLRAENHEAILQSEGYVSKVGAYNGIYSVQANAPFDSQYVRKEGLYRYWFVLIAANGEPLGRSETYSSASGREHGVAAVKRCAPIARISETAFAA